MRQILLSTLLAVIAGFAGAAGYFGFGLADKHVESYLMANPDLLPRMVAGWESKQAEDRLARAGDDLRTPFAGAVLGNPNGKHTLIKFTDYNCGYCRASVEEVQKLIAQDPELRVIIREWPIFEGSDRAASWALAAAGQGKFEPFFSAVFAGGDTSEAGLVAAAEKVGLDPAKLREAAASPQIAYELSRNTQFARELGFTGTPSWVVGDQIIEGAVPSETLAEAIEKAAASAGA